uniref:Uncharacterized protein n=1 Tax=Tanacetum cinerariifolium TaxID=118510 RepID=A0A6L2KG95_TANCI|nr:hypothetical protein [Tanacetum cinerariifolium]
MGEGSGQPADAHPTPSFDTKPPQPKKKTQKPREAKKKTTKVSQPSGFTDFVADEAVFKERGDSLGRATTTTSSLEAEQDSGNIHKTQPKATSNKTSSLGTSSGVNTPVSDEVTIKLKELMELCTNLSKKVLDLEDELKKIKTTYKIEVDDLKKRVEKLERKNKSRPHKLKRLYKVRLTAMVESSSDEEPALNKEDASKQGKNIDEIDANDEITLVDTHEDIIVEEFKAAGNQEVGIVNEPVSAALTIVTTAQPTEATKISVESTQTPTWKGITLQVPRESSTTKTASSQPHVQSKDKGKTKMIEADPRRKFFARKRAEEKRNKPPTKTQQRKIVSTYLKNMEGCRINELKHLDFDTLKKKFDIVFKRVNTFLDMDTEFVKGKKEKKAEGSSKRIGDELEQDDANKQKVNDNAKETVELNRFIDVILKNEKEAAIDVVPLDIVTPIIGWKVEREGKKCYYRILRAGGNS